ncbi:dioxygenase [Aquincola sp. S2]|uniref:Dioxygenase n=1 Tax=Pseudaquabacterium terrae TaxID=2732868 RepID=A0ABX2ENE9_9BURK|nr:dioxygenase [Aquabacterium terrae]
MTLLPPVFVSHGSPMTALEPGETGPFWGRLGAAIDALAGRPRAILAVSAHSLAREPVLLAAAEHPTVHDFGGFPDALYQLRYDTAGAPALATQVAAQLAESGLPVQRVDEGGLDHGIWTPLRFVYPPADIPVLPLAFPPDWTPAQLFTLGEALAPLAAEGVWVLATGSITHNLRLLFGAQRPPLDAPEIPPSAAFRRWFVERSAARDWEALFNYRAQAPHAALMHPSDEHLLPWYVAAGAGGRDAAAVRVHDALTYGCLGMDAYAFGPEGGSLARALEPPTI